MFSFETAIIAEAVSVLLVGITFSGRGWTGHPFAANKCRSPPPLAGAANQNRSFSPSPGGSFPPPLLIPGSRGGRKCCPSVPQRGLFPSETSEHNSQITVLYVSHDVYCLTQHHTKTVPLQLLSSAVPSLLYWRNWSSTCMEQKNQPGEDNPGLGDRGSGRFTLRCSSRTQT